jgi:hypothetical protein
MPFSPTGATTPPNIPAKDFWSITLYDNQTRSMLRTDQQSPSVSSQTKGLLVNADGSVDVYFGPKAPAGKEQNWIQTVPSNGWNTILRLYGPLEPWSIKPGGRGPTLEILCNAHAPRWRVVRVRIRARDGVDVFALRRHFLQALAAATHVSTGCLSPTSWLRMRQPWLSVAWSQVGVGRSIVCARS